jgi:RHS repeat-associated protein
MTAQISAPASATITFATTGGTLGSSHVDSGDKFGLPDALGRPWFSCNARGFVNTQDYDEMHRVVANRIARRGSATAQVYSRAGFGESLPLAAAQACNLRGRLAERFNQAGWALMGGMSLQGAVLATTSSLSCAYQTADDGMPAVAIPALTAAKPNGAQLQSQTYTTAQQRIDALGQTLEAVSPNGNLVQANYLLSGVPGSAGVDGATYLQDIRYNAKEQMLSCVTGVAANDDSGGLFTHVFRYDPKTYVRRQSYASTDAGFVAGLPDSDSGCAFVDGSGDAGRRQDTRCVFDPNGNVLECDDAYPAIVFGADSSAFAQSLYRYDALNRLLAADGVESPAASPVDGSPVTGFAAGALPLGAGGNAALVPYRQSYWHDDGNNVTAMNHTSNGSPNNAKSTAMKISCGSNRAIAASYYLALGGTASGTDIDESFFTGSGLFDAAGNQLKNADLTGMAWDFQEQLAQASYPNPGDPGGTVTEYYVYASGGVRTRKISVTHNAAGLMTQLDTVLYLGDVELRARYRQSDPGTGIAYDGEHVGNATQILDYSEQRIKVGHAQGARILSGILVAGGSTETKTYYGLSNHIDSCQAELDAQGNISNYQGFYPFGGTAFCAASDGAGDGSLTLKQIQYSGQEKDGTGLYFYGYRYYDAAGFRWTRPDPAGMAGSGLNLYQMLQGNPISYRDSNGMQGCGEYTFMRAGLPVFMFCFVWGVFFFLAQKYLPNMNDFETTAFIITGRQVARIAQTVTKLALSLTEQTIPIEIRASAGRHQTVYTLRLSLRAFPVAFDNAVRPMGWCGELCDRLWMEGIGECWEVLALAMITNIQYKDKTGEKVAYGSVAESNLAAFTLMGFGYIGWEWFNIWRHKQNNVFKVYDISCQFAQHERNRARCFILLKDIIFARWEDTLAQGVVRFAFINFMVFPNMQTLTQAGLWVARNEVARILEHVVQGLVKLGRNVHYKYTHNEDRPIYPDEMSLYLRRRIVDNHEYFQLRGLQASGDIEAGFSMAWQFLTEAPLKIIAANRMPREMRNAIYALPAENRLLLRRRSSSAPAQALVPVPNGAGGGHNGGGGGNNGGNG